MILPSAASHDGCLVLRSCILNSKELAGVAIRLQVVLSLNLTFPIFVRSANAAVHLRDKNNTKIITFLSKNLVVSILFCNFAADNVIVWQATTIYPSPTRKTSR